MTTGKRKRGEQTATTTDQTATTTAVQGTAKRTITFEEASAIVQDQQFWQQGEYVMKLLAPVVKKTKLLETDGCSVAMVYQTVVDLLDNLQYCNPEDLVAVQVRSLIEDQKFDTMRIAFLLDPATNPDDFLGDDLMKALYDIPVVAKRLGYSEDMQKAVFREVNIFVDVKWDWSPEQQATQQRVLRSSGGDISAIYTPHCLNLHGRFSLFQLLRQLQGLVGALTSTFTRLCL